MILPEEYCIQKFFQLAGYPKPKYGGRVYEGGCPVCKEGSSWRKKRRLYYVLENNLIYCHNCGWSGDPVKFIIYVQGLTYKEVIQESKKYNLLPTDVSEKTSSIDTVREIPSLPHDSINLFDKSQLQYYNNDKTVQGVIKLIESRKINTSVNKPKSLWVSLTDFVHKNRLIIPFYDLNDKITFYQTRTVFENSDISLPKYLSKIGGEKSIFNINNVTDKIDKIYIFEGPIDACFVKNGVAVAGIQENSDVTFSPKQTNQLLLFNTFEKVWVLDSQWVDSASRNKTSKLIDQGERVFIWPKEYGKQFKDFNDMCIALGTSEIPHTFIDKNTYVGLKAKIALSQICP